MKFKICAFKKPAFADNVESLVSQLTSHYLDSSVSVKYVSESGIVGIVFIDVSSDGQCRGTYSDKLIDFSELDSLAAVDFEVDLAA